MPGKRWTEHEKEFLIRQAREGRKLPQIHIPARSPAAINQQRQRLREAGFVSTDSKRSLRLWTIREIRGLQDYTKRYRLSAAQITRAELLPGRSKDSISQQMKRQGLGDPKRRQAARTAHRLDAQERVALERFLGARGRKLSSAQVAKRFKISPQTVTAYRRCLKLQLSWHEARASAQYRQRAEKLRHILIQRTRARWMKWRAKRREVLKNLQWQMRRERQRHELRQCVRCGEAWFAVKAFFALTTRRRGGVVTYTMSRTCRACWAERGR